MLQQPRAFFGEERAVEKPLEKGPKSRVFRAVDVGCKVRRETVGLRVLAATIRRSEGSSLYFLFATRSMLSSMRSRVLAFCRQSSKLLVAASR